MAGQAPVTDRPGGDARASKRSLPWTVSARRGGLLIAVLLAATGLVFSWQASMLDLGHPGLPGPGFVPMLLGALLVAFSIVVGLVIWCTSAEGEPVELGHPHVLITLAGLLAVPLLFERLGAYLALGLLSAGLLMFVARLSPLLAALWTVLGMTACWGLFQLLLGMRLPMGPF
jgi:hypothetical protein